MLHSTIKSPFEHSNFTLNTLGASFPAADAAPVSDFTSSVAASTASAGTAQTGAEAMPKPNKNNALSATQVLLIET